MHYMQRIKIKAMDNRNEKEFNKNSDFKDFEAKMNAESYKFFIKSTFLIIVVLAVVILTKNIDLQNPDNFDIKVVSLGLMLSSMVGLALSLFWYIKNFKKALKDRYSKEDGE